jgi:hypothetical protein
MMMTMVCIVAIGNPTQFLTVESSFDAKYENGASLKIGDKIYPGTSPIEISKDGVVKFSVPFNAGTYTFYGCTKYVLNALSVSDGLRMRSKITRKPLCPFEPYGVFTFRKFTNKKSIVQFDTKGNRRYKITGTELGIVVGDNADYVAKLNGTMEADTDVNETISIPDKTIFVSSSTGYNLTSLREPYLAIQNSLDGFMLITDQTSIITIDGKRYTGGKLKQYNSNAKITVSNLVGQSKIFRIKQIQKNIWQILNSN